MKDETIWRYMDTSKFLFLLEESALRELRDKLLAKHSNKKDAVKAWIVELNSHSLHYYWNRQNIFINYQKFQVDNNCCYHKILFDLDI